MSEKQKSSLAVFAKILSMIGALLVIAAMNECKNRNDIEHSVTNIKQRIEANDEKSKLDAQDKDEVIKCMILAAPNRKAFERDLPKILNPEPSGALKYGTKDILKLLRIMVIKFNSLSVSGKGYEIEQIPEVVTLHDLIRERSGFEYDSKSIVNLVTLMSEDGCNYEQRQIAPALSNHLKKKNIVSGDVSEIGDAKIQTLQQVLLSSGANRQDIATLFESMHLLLKIDATFDCAADIAKLEKRLGNASKTGINADDWREIATNEVLFARAMGLVLSQPKSPAATEPILEKK